MSKVPAYDVPGPIQFSEKTPAIAANTVQAAFPVFIAPCNGIAKNFRWVPTTAITGDNSNTRNLNVIYKGTDGSTGAAEVANLDLVLNVNTVAYDDKSIPLNGSYPNGVTMVQNAVLAFEIEDIGTSPAVDVGIFVFDFYPSN